MFNSFLSTFLVGLFLLIFLVLYLEEELNTYLKIANYYLDLICEPPLLAGRGRPLCESGRNNHCLVNTEDQNKTNKTNGSGHRITFAFFDSDYTAGNRINYGDNQLRSTAR